MREKLDPGISTNRVLFTINGVESRRERRREGGREGGGFGGSARFVLCKTVIFWDIEKRGWDGPRYILGAFWLLAYVVWLLRYCCTVFQWPVYVRVPLFISSYERKSFGE